MRRLCGGRRCCNRGASRNYAHTRNRFRHQNNSAVQWFLNQLISAQLEEQYETLDKGNVWNIWLGNIA
jgi:hypothetical protein